MVPLRLAGSGFWIAGSEVAPCRVVVAGREDAPDEACRATLDDIVDRWDAVKASILAFVRGLPSDAFVRLEGVQGGFVVSDCGFEGELFFASVSVTDVERSGRAEVTFYTGFPDGYVTFELGLEGDALTDLKAFCS